MTNLEPKTSYKGTDFDLLPKHSTNYLKFK